MIVIDAVKGDRRVALEKAGSLITAGGIAAFPTETFYGLGARYDDARALERLYALKGRPAEKAIPLLIGGLEMLALVARSVDAAASRIARRFWPGPLTILFDARDGLPGLITAGTGKVAVRVPGSSFALDLARSLPFPITATSANISGEPPAASAAEVANYFGSALDLLVDGGRTAGGRPSTIIEIRGGEVILLRPGAVSRDDIERALLTSPE